jgi:hypothetical protein
MKLFTKKALPLYILLISGALFLSGCGKEAGPVKTELETLYDHLTSELGNKKWFLKSIYVNGAATALTDAQKKYYKTYRQTATPNIADFLDDDGNRGSAYLLSPLQLKEVITNGPIGSATRDYVIRELSAKTLDLEIAPPQGTPGNIVREVYYAN